MKNAIFALVVALASCICNIQAQPQSYTKTSADSIVANIETFINTPVSIEGQIIHICGVDARKMKLKSAMGAIIEIVSADSLTRFAAALNKKMVTVQGTVQEVRIEKAYVEKVENEKTLLCHIDHTPCKDTAWVNDLKKSGAADGLSKKDTDQLRKTMEQTGKEYISVVVIVAEKVEIL